NTAYSSIYNLSLHDALPIFIDNNYDGEYLFNNKKTHRMNDNETSELRNTTVGFVFQNFKLIGNDTIIENTYLPLIYNGIKRKERDRKSTRLNSSHVSSSYAV